MTPKNQNTTDDLITYEQAAKLLGVKLGTLYSMVNRGAIPHFRIGPRLVRFRRTDLEAWLVTCQRPPK